MSVKVSLFSAPGGAALRVSSIVLTKLDILDCLTLLKYVLVVSAVEECTIICLRHIQYKEN